MVQANELRIGNYVFFDKEENITGEITSISENRVWLQLTRPVEGRDFNQECSNEYIEPIELTPEILEKSGFENVGYGGGYNSFKYKKGYVILFYDETEKAAFFCYYKDENKKKGRTIRTTHDLQNLHFALTGEELEINL